MAGVLYDDQIIIFARGLDLVDWLVRVNGHGPRFATRGFRHVRPFRLGCRFFSPLRLG